MAHFTLLAILGVLAGAPVALAPAASAPVAVATGHSVLHAADGLTVRVPASATYVGSERFDLYGVADAEVHVFAEADAGKHLKKLYWIQFESYLPSKPDVTHDYTTDRRAQLWGTTTWVRSGPVPVNTPRAGSDREHVQALLTRAGYTIPPEVMNVRMVQLLDDPKGTGRGRNELMLIYSEDLAQSGKTLAELRTDDKLSDAWGPIGEVLMKRATTSFQVERN